MVISPALPVRCNHSGTSVSTSAKLRLSDTQLLSSQLTKNAMRSNLLAVGAVGAGGNDLCRYFRRSDRAASNFASRTEVVARERAERCANADVLSFGGTKLGRPGLTMTPTITVPSKTSTTLASKTTARVTHRHLRADGSKNTGREEGMRTVDR